MSEIIQKDGVDVEVFSSEELEAQKQEAIEQYKLENPDKTDELTQLQEALRVKEEELAKTKDKDQNFVQLRKAKEDAEKKLTDFTKDIDTKISNVKREVMEGVLKDTYNDNLKALAGDDAELAKKVEYHYKRLGDVASTKDEIGNKMRDAYLLATKPEGYDALNSSVLSTGGVGRLNIQPKGQKLSAEETAVAGKLGLSESDLKKYNA